MGKKQFILLLFTAVYTGTGNRIICPTSKQLIKPFLSKCLDNWPEDSKTIFRNRQWNYFSHFQTTDQKTSLSKVCIFGLKISKQEMELFQCSEIGKTIYLEESENEIM